MRQVNLGLDFFRASMGTTRRFGRTLPIGALKVSTNFFGLVLFERTGMGLLLGDANFGQRIEDRLAFDFQLSGQIIDSNLTHPPLCSSERCPAKSSYQPHGNLVIG